MIKRRNELSHQNCAKERNQTHPRNKHYSKGKKGFHSRRHKETQLLMEMTLEKEKRNRNIPVFQQSSLSVLPDSARGSHFPNPLGDQNTN